MLKYMQLYVNGNTVTLRKGSKVTACENISGFLTIIEHKFKKRSTVFYSPNIIFSGNEGTQP